MWLCKLSMSEPVNKGQVGVGWVAVYTWLSHGVLKFVSCVQQNWKYKCKSAMTYYFSYCLQWCNTCLFFSCSNIDDLSLFWLQQRPFNCISRGGREGRVPCHVPPSDISKGPGSRLQSGGDDAGPKRQKPLHSAGRFDSQQASPQGNRCVWSCWREAGGA